MVALATLTVLCASWFAYEMQRSVAAAAKKKLDQTIARIDIPIQYGGIDVGLSEVTVKEITVGTAKPIIVDMVKAELGLNPFSSRFMGIDTITIGRVEADVTLLDISRLAEELKGSVTGNDREEVSSTGKFATISLRQANVALSDAAGKPIVGLKQISATYANGKGEFTIGEASGPADLSLAHLTGTITKKSKRFEFSVRTPKEAAGNQLESSGSLRSDLSQAKVSLKSAVNDPASSLNGLSIAGELRAQRDGDNSYELEVDGKTVLNEVTAAAVATQTVGPIAVQWRGFGLVGPDTIIIRSLVGKIGDTKPPVQVSFSGLVENRQQLTGFLSLPQTPCQNILASIPPTLIPSLQGFKLANAARAEIEIILDIDRASEFTYRWITRAFECEVIETPDQFRVVVSGSPRELAYDVHESVNHRLPPRKYVNLEQISTYLPKALLTAEDASFYIHKGFDEAAIESAIRRNFQENKIAVGGSTLTMQTVKNLFLSHERTLSRKAQELFLAWFLERRLTKDQIMELYLNIVEYGPGIFGVADATEYYFNKSPRDINLVEAAFLVNLLPSPIKRHAVFCRGHYTPGFKELAQSLLKRMNNLGHIGIVEFDQAVGDEPTFHEATRAATCPPGSTNAAPADAMDHGGTDAAKI
jgi:hypothetical protein